ncbi:hypothetical protein AB833_06660 [Chromatiales bacterium (ex Bugula neritina AB1)]|nr:hypothetical protein AB833_06660 [Chromatiales bacterium (ex Bugula neritina AB1)]
MQSTSQQFFKFISSCYGRFRQGVPILKTFARLYSASVLTLFLFVTQTSLAALPDCSSAAFDTDGDGFGWENNSSCRVSAGSAGNKVSGSSLPVCNSADSDPDGDGFGWENSKSCRVSELLIDGASSSSRKSCLLTSSDPDGDGFGWENNETCVIDSTTGNSGNTSGSGSSDGGQSGNLGGSGSSDGGQSGNLGGSGSSDGAQTGGGSNNGSGNNFTVDNPGGLIRSSTLTPLKERPQDTCLTRQDTLNRNYHGAIRTGDFILATNAWNFSAAGSFEWEQCIYANENGAAVGWNYDWGAGGGSGDYFVRSYPELIYGVKSQGEVSAPKAVTGLPARIDQLPFISIDYSFSSSQYGPNRTVNASNNPRFPNGSIISGERNIAIESFLHPSDASGNCPESVVQRSNGRSNHTYEVMVWLDSGAERLPAGPSDYVTTATLDGAVYNIYTKNSDRKYIAFVAQNPQSSGTLNWTTFIEWSRQYAHRVQQVFGANTNSVRIEDNWCLANILVGTEIFWGAGDLNIVNWQVNQY